MDDGCKQQWEAANNNKKEKSLPSVDSVDRKARLAPSRLDSYYYSF